MDQELTHKNSKVTSAKVTVAGMDSGDEPGTRKLPIVPSLRFRSVEALSHPVEVGSSQPAFSVFAFFAFGSAKAPVTGRTARRNSHRALSKKLTVSQR